MKTTLSLGILAVMIIASAAMASEFRVEPRNPRIAPRFDKMLFSATADNPASIWVFFTDKEVTDRESYDQALSAAASRFTEAALERRRMRTEEEGALDYYDIPVSQTYIRQVSDLGLDITSESRWLNAVSGYADYETMLDLARLSFVAEIRPVARGVRHPEPEDLGSLYKDIPDAASLDSTDYGPSYHQLNMINVQLMHQNGYSGKGEKIAIFDTGFELDHPAFDSMNWTNTYNFVDDNEDVSTTTDHGTSVLSIVGGFAPGELIGPAFGAEYILAKTENIYGEDTTEERFWIEAAEWADSLGATIISSSLGYPDWYTYEDLDGRTAPITVAADIAVSRGIAVFNSAGNERQREFYYITPPADGFGVMAIGSVDSLGQLALSSSAGPTYDGRLKPEVVARGVGVYSANYLGGYRTRFGTSAAAPLAAGAAALILEANRNWTPMQLREAMMRSGDRHENPDNLYGHGLFDTFNAAELFKIAPIEPITIRVTEYVLVPIIISKPNWSLDEIDTLTLTAENLPDSAVLITTQLYNGYSEIVYWGWPQDLGSHPVRLILTADIVDVGILADTAEFVLRVVENVEIAAGPNPFSDSLTIFIHPVMAGEPTDISVHTINGEKVWDAFSDTYNSKNGTVVWDGTNNQGREVAPGVYYIVVRTLWSVETFKVFKK